MKRISLFLAIAIACPLLLCPLAAGQGTGSSTLKSTVQSTEKADRALLNRLIRQVRRIDRDTEETMNKAMAEARDNGGSADRSTKAQLLSLRDQRDRLFSRMLILSMRHGWEIPDFDKPTVTRSSRAEAEHSVFGAIDTLVYRRFAAEAKQMAATLPLPVISLKSMEWRLDRTTR